MKYIIFISSFMMCLANSLLPQISGTISGSKIDSLINYVKQDFIVPGIAVAVIHDGSAIYKKSYGFADIDDRVPVTDTTVFNVGSISKMVTAWGVLKLMEEGKLNIEKPAEEYLHRWHLPDSEYDIQKVTIRGLLSHTAGLSLAGYPGFDRLDDLPTLEESLSGKTNGVGSVYLKNEPGLTYDYSGGGFSVIQLIIEEVSGERFEDYMQVKVLRPLGMKHSTFDQAYKRKSGIKAVPYSGDGVRISDRKFRAMAAAGFQSTLTDMIILAKAELNLSENPKVITHESLQMMQEPAAPAEYYGLGHQIRTYNDYQVIGHVGSNKGWTSHIEVIPAIGDGIIILTNSNAGFFIHNILVCEWIKQTLKTVWPKEFCLSVPSARFDFIRDDLDLLTRKIEIEETIINRLKFDFSLAEETFSLGHYSQAKAQLETFMKLISEIGTDSTIDRVIHMSTSIINEIKYYDLN